MKTTAFGFLFMLITFSVQSQQSLAEERLLSRLDSLRKTTGPARDFAEVYYLTTLYARDYFRNADTALHQYINRFETVFGDYFMEAAGLFNSGKPVPEIWRPYFEDSTGSLIRRQFLAINAHINGDCWQALARCGSKDELEQYRRAFFRFDKALAAVFRIVYAGSRSDPRFDRWHRLSLGLLHPYSRYLLRHWRIRQEKLAVCSFAGDKKYNRLRTRTDRNRIRINRLILRHL